MSTLKRERERERERERQRDICHDVSMLQQYRTTDTAIANRSRSVSHKSYQSNTLLNLQNVCYLKLAASSPQLIAARTHALLLKIAH